MTLNGGDTTLSGNAAFTYNATSTASATSAGSTTLTVTSAAGFTVGEPIAGPGVAPGTTISTISGNTLTLSLPASVASGATVFVGGPTGILVQGGASLTLDNSGANAGANRLGNRPLTLTGGNLNFIGSAAGNSVEGTAGFAGTLILAVGQSTINITNNSNTNSTILNFGALTQNAGSTLDIEELGTNNVLGTATNQINIGQAVTVGANPSGLTTLVLSSTAGLFVGETLSGFGISNSTTISSITNGTTLVLNQAPLVVAAGETIEFGMPLANANFNGTSGTLTNGLLPRITIGGNSWATWSPTAGLTAFTAYNLGTGGDLSTGAITDTMQANDSTLNIGLPSLNSGNTTLPGPKTYNALDLASTTTNLDISGGGILTLTSGGILVTGNGITDTLSVPRIAFINASPVVNSTIAVEGLFQIGAGATLNVTGSVVTGSSGFTKGLSGNLTFSATQFFTGGNITLNGGTTTLNAATNTINPVASGLQLIVNQGATLDLNGTTQWVGQLSSDNNVAMPSTGGTITSSSGPALLVINENSGSTVWGGSITGTSANPITFARLAGNTLTLESANSYYGATILMGGALALQDNATIPNTSSILLNYAGLSLNNNSGLQVNSNDRINDAAPITINAATITLNGRANTYTTESFGALTAASGASTITVSIGGTGLFSNTDLSFASISHSPTATVNFTTGNTLGAGGSNPRILFTNASGLGYSASTGVIGAWAIANSDTFAAYNPSLGVGPVGTDGFQGYTGGYMSGGITSTYTANGATSVVTYSGGTLNGFGAGNVTDIESGVLGLNQVIVLPAGGANTDYIRFAGVAENDIAFTNPTDVLNVNLGGIIHSNSGVGSTIIGTTPGSGVLTSGGTASSGTTQLVIYNTGNTTTAVGLNSTGTVNNSNVVTLNTGTTTANLFAGMSVTGTGILTGAYITQILNATQFTINYIASAASSAANTYTFGANIVVNSAIHDNGLGNLTELNKSGTGTLTLTSGITSLTDGVALTNGTTSITVPTGFSTFNGEVVTGPGIPAGTVISSGGGGTTLTLSKSITGSGMSVLTFGTNGAAFPAQATAVGNATTISGISTAGLAGLYIGEAVAGANIPAGTTVTAVNAATNSFTISAPAAGNAPVATGLTFTETATGSVSNTTSVTGLASTTGMFVGEVVTGSNIPAGATIASIVNTTSITLSAAATGTSIPVSTGLSFINNTTGTVGTTNTINGFGSTSGILAGDTVTGANIPAGTTVSSVNNGTTITISTAATAGIAESLVFGSATGNTYSGGTVINEGTVNLDGATLGTVTIPAGGLTIIGSPTAIGATTVNMVNVGGQIDPSNVVTLLGRSTLNLVGNNTLNSLVFNNNGGEGTPTITNVGTLTLTNLNPITATSNNALFINTLSGGTIALAQGVNNFNIGAIQTGGVSYTNLGFNTGTIATMSISSIIGQTGLGTSIVKTGNGILQLSGANTFDSGFDLAAGGLIIAAGSNITTVNTAPASGPLGGGPNSTFTINGLSTQPGVVDNTNTINGLNTTNLYVGEAVSGPNIPAGATIATITPFGTSITLSANDSGTGGNLTPSNVIFGTQTTLLSSASTETVSNAVVAQGDLVFNGQNSLSLNGLTTLQDIGTQNITVVNPLMTAVLAGTITGNSVTTLNKLGLGILSLSGATNTFGGSLQVNIVGGSLFVAADGSLGGAPSAFTPNAILIENGASLGSNTTTATIGVIPANGVSQILTRGITIGAGGGYFANSSTTAVLTIDTLVTNTFSSASGAVNGVFINGPGATAFNANEGYNAIYNASVAAGTPNPAYQNEGIQGNIYVTGGAFRAIDGQGLPATSSLVLNGGTYETSGTFTRAVGTGAGQVQINSGNSGFSGSTAASGLNASGSAALGLPAIIDPGRHRKRSADVGVGKHAGVQSHGLRHQRRDVQHLCGVAEPDRSEHDLCADLYGQWGHGQRRHWIPEREYHGQRERRRRGSGQEWHRHPGLQ